jgi:hypothetical protein
LQIWSQKSQLGKTTDANRLVTKTITLAVSIHHKINTHKLLGSDQMPQYLWKLVLAKFGECLSLSLSTESRVLLYIQTQVQGGGATYRYQ